MSREHVEVVEDELIPEGFGVTFHELVGRNLTDRWFEATFPDGEKIGDFGCRDEAINSCVRHSEPLPEDSPKGFESDWQDVIPRVKTCKICGKLRNKDGSSVQWRCSVCRSRVCMECTLQVVPGMYYDQTYCSRACWECDGRPSE